MESHFEDQMTTAYTLVADRPKLKRADPSSRTKCKLEDAPVRSIPGGRPLTDRVVTCQNVTMAQFADELQMMSVYAETPYIAFPVLDGTHLDGAWDFTLTFNPTPPNRGRGVANTTSDGLRVGTPVASDPAGSTSLFDALEKQLGLKLQTEKRLYPVLVIDHIEDTPTQN